MFVSNICAVQKLDRGGDRFFCPRMKKLMSKLITGIGSCDSRDYRFYSFTVTNICNYMDCYIFNTDLTCDMCS